MSLWTDRPPAPSKFAMVALACAGAMVFVSCALFRPPERTPEDTGPAPDVYPAPMTMEASAPDRWWESFGDPALDELVRETLSGNKSLIQAAARLEQAEQLAAQRNAARLPWVDLEAKAAHTRRHVDEPGLMQEEDQTFETWGLGLALSYELDLWGRVRSAARSAALEVGAAEADYETAAMTLSAEVTLDYLELLATRETIEILNEQLETNRKVLELIELRFRRAQATALDVLQQRAVVAGVEALIPVEKGDERILINEIDVLRGRPPGLAPFDAAAGLPEPPPLPEAGIPADLLSRRPDVKAAWMRLRSADWAVSQAKAERMPAIRLTASVNYESDEFETLFDNWAENVAASLVAPLFEAGRRKAEVERRRAVVLERLARYRETVLAAMKDVLNAMAAEKAQAEALEFLEKQLELAERSREQAIVRYGRGGATYLRVLDAIDRENELNRAVVTARFRLLAFRVQLYRALGGDFGEIMDRMKNTSANGEMKGETR